MIKVKFAQHQYMQLNQFLIDGSGIERICYVFGYHYQDCYGNIVVVPDTIIFPNNNDNYAHSTYVRLHDDIAEYIYREFAKSDHTVIINCHSHPFDYSNTVSFSSIDDRSDRAEYDYLFHKLAKSKSQPFIHMAYLRSNNATAMRLILDKKFDTNISIRLIGRQYQYVNNSIGNQQKPRLDLISQKDKLDEQFVRHTHIFHGQTAQKNLADVWVAVVGCGGTGSIVAESLVRLGVKNITLIDDDLIELTNLNRLQGVAIDDVGKHKAKVIACNITKYAKNIKVHTITTTAFSKEAYEYLKSSDIIFACVDNGTARFFINQISSSFLIPVFNVGVVIGNINSTPNNQENKSDQDSQQAIECVWRVDVFVPYTTNCMDCAVINVYDRSKASVEFFDQSTYLNMVRAGYIAANPDIKDPSVYSLNQQAVSQLMNEFHNYFVGFKEFVPHINGYLSPKQRKSEHTHSSLFKVNQTGSCGTCIDYLGKCGKYHDGIQERLES